MDYVQLIQDVKMGVSALDAGLGLVRKSQELVKSFQKEGKAETLEVQQLLQDAIAKSIEVKNLQLQMLDWAVDLRQQQIALDQRAAALDNFDGISGDMQLVQIYPNTRAYSKKLDVRQPEELQIYYCETCFGQRSLSPLKLKQTSMYHNVLQCTQCEGTFRIAHDGLAKAAAAAASLPVRRK